MSSWLNKGPFQVRGREHSLPFRSLGVDKLPNPTDKIAQRLKAGIPGVPAPDGYAAPLGFAVADDQHERHLLKLRVPDARVQFLVAVVQAGAQVGAAQFLANLASVSQVLVANGEHHGLHRSQPDRESSRIMLNQHHKETL